MSGDGLAAAGFGVALVAVAAVVFVVADCAGGVEARVRGVVVGHEYRPPETDISCTSEGCVPTRTGASYVVVVRVEGGALVEVGVERRVYYAVRDGGVCEVEYRVGKWTGTRWLLRLVVPVEAG